MNSESNYIRMNDDELQQSIGKENQIQIDQSHQNILKNNLKQNQVLPNQTQNDNKSYLQYDDNYFPYVDMDSEGFPVVEEQIYYKLNKKENQRIEWTIRIERSKISLNSVKNENSKIEILWENLLGASFSPKTVGGFPIFSFKIYLMKKENKQCGQAFNRYMVELDFFMEMENRAKNLTILIQNFARNMSYLQNAKDDILEQKIPDYNSKLLVFINPAGGDGSAKKKWSSIQHLFQHSGHQPQIVLTKHKDHAMQYVRNVPADDLLEYNGIVTISGDGLPHEVVNGLFNRPDRDEVCSKITLGVLPGGSGNALINSILYEINEPRTLEGAAYLICKGNVKNMDLIHMQTRSNPNIYSFLSLAWAYLADVDLNSEHLRFLAGFRFDVMGTYRAICQKNYEAMLYTCNEEINELPDINQEISSGDIWEEKQQRDFKYFMLMNLPLITRTDLNAPNSKCNDGVLDLQYLHANEGWSQLVKYVLTFQSGSHFDKKTQLPVKSQKFKYEKIKAFRLQSLTDSLGLISIDGERYESDIIQGRILPGRLRIFSL